MKTNRFLTAHIICIAAFYAVAYLFISKIAPLPDTGTASVEMLYGKAVTSPLFCPSENLPPENSARAAVVMDAKSGAVIYQKSADLRLPMASTTKIMTAKIILDKMALDTPVKITKPSTLIEGSSIYLTENETLTVESLLYGLLLESGNDAASALAIACSGSEEEFVVLMNEYANKLNLQSTSFANPHGLTAENHYTTAYELAYITKCAMENEVFRKIVSSKSYIATPLEGEITRYFFNHNKLLSRYDGACGVKTGYTLAAGRCLVSAAEKDGESYICVTLDDKNDWSDHASLLDYAFYSYDSLEIARPQSFAFSYDGRRYVCEEPVYITTAHRQNPAISYRITLNEQGALCEFFADGTEWGQFYMPVKSDSKTDY